MSVVFRYLLTMLIDIYRYRALSILFVFIFIIFTCILVFIIAEKWSENRQITSVI